MDNNFWKGRSVFLTGHTGFKGAWLTLLLERLGARVSGFALAPESEHDLFEVADVHSALHRHEIGDVRDLDRLVASMRAAEPEIVLHLAAQSLVRLSYQEPVSTYATNVIGTVHVLEAVRACSDTRATIVVTSDKCYENAEWMWGYRENDRLGGHDPYSNSKACAELVTASYRKSFFPPGGSSHVASARAGNVIGGGDWARDRLIPDAIRAFMADQPVRIRNPHAIRPWQHVLDPISAYLLLAQRLYQSGPQYADGWNFGPSGASEVPVSVVISNLVQMWGQNPSWEIDGQEHLHEASYLKLDCSKALNQLNWKPVLNLKQSLSFTTDWYRAFQERKNMRAVTEGQIDDFLLQADQASAQNEATLGSGIES